MNTNITIVVLLMTMTFSTHAAAVYRGPATSLYYIDDGIEYSVLNIVRTAITPYGTSHTLQVILKNNRVANYVPELAVKIVVKGLYSNQYYDSPDFSITGCGQWLPVGQTCTADLTYTPITPDVIDGVVHAVDETLIITWNGSIFLGPTVEGLAQ
ncbi:MAG: hypothetical protein HY080_14940 [Gammaproteobacteria bacterium]|nr:hypothetical protein [Gammaproteobacteria bacterium]